MEEAGQAARQPAARRVAPDPRLDGLVELLLVLRGRRVDLHLGQAVPLLLAPLLAALDALVLQLGEHRRHLDRTGGGALALDEHVDASRAP